MGTNSQMIKLRLGEPLFRYFIASATTRSLGPNPKAKCATDPERIFECTMIEINAMRPADADMFDSVAGLWHELERKFEGWKKNAGQANTTHT